MTQHNSLTIGLQSGYKGLTDNFIRHFYPTFEVNPSGRIRQAPDQSSPITNYL